MTKIAETFIQEIVIGFGFINGLWINIGFDPESSIIQILLDMIYIFNPSFTVTYISWFIPIILALSILVPSLLAYYIGGIPGLLAVIFAFIGGIFINLTIGALLLLLGIVLGLITPYTK